MSLAYGCSMAVKIQLILAETDDLSAALFITELSVAAYSLYMWSVHVVCTYLLKKSNGTCIGHSHILPTFHQFLNIKMLLNTLNKMEGIPEMSTELFLSAVHGL